jgi:hypothetical protein
MSDHTTSLDQAPDHTTSQDGAPRHFLRRLLPRHREDDEAPDHTTSQDKAPDDTTSQDEARRHFLRRLLPRHREDNLRADLKWLEAMRKREECQDCFDFDGAEHLVREAHTLRGYGHDMLLITNALFVAVLVALLAAAPVWLSLGWKPAVVVGVLGTVVLLGGLISRQRYWEIDDELVQNDHKFDRLKLPIQDAERRALKLFQNHSTELRRYYGQALRHGSFIFWIGVACMVAGFGIVGVALATVVEVPASDTSEQVVIAALGAVSGLMANFIGAIYIRMYSQTIKSLGDFHTRLVGTHHLHFANFLVAKIEPEEDQSRAFAEMASALAQGLAETQGPNPQTSNGVVVTPAPVVQGQDGSPLPRTSSSGRRQKRRLTRRRVGPSE